MEMPVEDRSSERGVGMPPICQQGLIGFTVAVSAKEPVIDIYRLLAGEFQLLLIAPTLQ